MRPAVQNTPFVQHVSHNLYFYCVVRYDIYVKICVGVCFRVHYVRRRSPLILRGKNQFRIMKTGRLTVRT